LKTYLIIFSFLVNVLAFGQKIEIGQTAPDFEIGQTYGQTLKAKKLSDLKGKFVILDFWATWCKPCVKTMPYIERIKEQFGDTLVVMAISDESPEEIKLFLNNKATAVNYLVDNQSIITSKYKVSAIPHSVLIGADGQIKAIGSPLSFTPSIIRKVMENQVVEIVKTVISQDNDPILDKIPKGVQFEFDVTPYNQNQASFIRDVSKGEYANRRLYFSNITIKAIYEYLYNMPNRGVLKIKSLEKFSNGNEASNLYCVDIIVRPEEATKRFQIGIEQMHKHFGLQSRVEYMTLMAKVLRVQSKDMLPKIAPYNAMESQATTFDNLAATITSFNTFGMPVVDATNRSERFIISFDKLPDEPYQLINALQNYGLTITEEIQKIPTLILFERD
jgi:thiol-disulfide isomerase/thioredoxin